MEKVLILGDKANYWNRKLCHVNGIQLVDNSSVGQVDIVLGHEKDIDELDLLPFEKLKWIQFFSAGISSDLAERINSRYVVTTSKGIHGQAMFEYVLYGLLHLNNRSTFELNCFNNWQRRRRALSLQSGQRVLLLGVGNIGTYLATKFSELGMAVDAFANSVRLVKGVNEIYSSLSDLDLSNYSIVISSLPLTDDTNLLVGESFFEKMCCDAVFINVGRGGTVDEIALGRALKSGSIKGAVLDTFTCEPVKLKEFALSGLSNCLCSPHVSGYFLESHDLFISKFEGLLDLYRDDSLQSELNGKY